MVVVIPATESFLGLYGVEIGYRLGLLGLYGEMDGKFVIQRAGTEGCVEITEDSDAGDVTSISGFVQGNPT